MATNKDSWKAAKSTWKVSQVVEADQNTKSLRLFVYIDKLPIPPAYSCLPIFACSHGNVFFVPSSSEPHADSRPSLSLAYLHLYRAKPCYQS